MYSTKKRLKAVELFLKYDFSYSDVFHELGYPNRRTLTIWYEQYLEEQRTGIIRPPNERMSKYTENKKKDAVDYYLKHGKSISRTIRAMGYPTRETFRKWRNELTPKERKIRLNHVQFSQEQKMEAVATLCLREDSAQIDFGSKIYEVIVGTLGFSNGNCNRYRNRGQFGIAVTMEFGGYGIRAAMMKVLLTWADEDKSGSVFNERTGDQPISEAGFRKRRPATI
ncbi:MAG: transposase [ANME-2 cluster archaeon]|nr:transposase [ANME-2 cluster archaeon]